MHFFIEKFKIANFLSFFGEYEVELKPFTAIMCNYHEGRKDFLKALEFVFGDTVMDHEAENPVSLVHKALREEFFVSSVKSHVEVTIKLVHDNKHLSFRKTIKNGNTFGLVEHRISNVITSRFQYEEKLNSLNLNLKNKNLIFYKSYFDNCIWGSTEDLENTIYKCLRSRCNLEELRAARKKVKHWLDVKERFSQNNYNSINRVHCKIANFARNFENVLADRESLKKESLKNIFNCLENHSTDLLEEPTDLKLSHMEDEENKIKIAILNYEEEIKCLLNTLHDVQTNSAFVTGNLYHEEIKLASASSNTNILKDRINELKINIQRKESELLKIWKDTEKIEVELRQISNKISDTLLDLNEIQTNNNLQNRFTSFGRFSDYLCPSPYAELLKHIIGNDIFFAHLCDTYAKALESLELMKLLKYEGREEFLIFRHYSHQLKDTLTASGEKGVEINNLEQLLIFLCKLALFELIDDVPVIVQKSFDYDGDMPPLGKYIIYVQNNIHFTSDGLISYKASDNRFIAETDEELERNIKQLKMIEEIKYGTLNELIFFGNQILQDMKYLENDIFYFEQKLNNLVQLISKKCQEYDDDLSREPQKEIKQIEESSFGKFSEEEHSTLVHNRETFLIKLNKLVKEEETITRQLKNLNSKLQPLNTTSTENYRLQKKCVRFDNSDKTQLFIEREFRKLKKSMNIDDLEDFLGSQEWRKSFISSLIKESKSIHNELKASKQSLQDVETARRACLYPLIEHCNQHFSSTFNHLMDKSLPFVNLNFDSEKDLQITSSIDEEYVNLTPIENFNTLIRFISILVLFIELAVHDHIPLIIFDEIEDFFPHSDDNFEAVLDSNVIEEILPKNENNHYHFLMRIGEYLSEFIRKHVPRRSIRKNGSQGITGPMQILFFAKEQLIHSANHYIWIQKQDLPDEYSTDNCNSYSEIHEIQIEKIVN